MECPLKEGEKYKITGGKYAKHKYCILNKVCPTFSDVNLCKEDGSVNTEIHKVKNCFLFVEPTIDMPDASQLQVVDASVDIDKLYEEQQAQKTNMDKLEDAIKSLGDITNPSMNGMNETLEITEEDYENKEFVEKEEEIVNITDGLPSIEEALQLQKDYATLTQKYFSLERKLIEIKVLVNQD